MKEFDTQEEAFHYYENNDLFYVHGPNDTSTNFWYAESYKLLKRNNLFIVIILQDQRFFHIFKNGKYVHKIEQDFKNPAELELYNAILNYLTENRNKKLNAILK